MLEQHLTSGPANRGYAVGNPELAGQLDTPDELMALVDVLARLNKTGYLALDGKFGSGVLTLLEGRVAGAVCGNENGPSALDGIVILLSSAPFAFRSTRPVPADLNIVLSPLELRQRLKNVAAEAIDLSRITPSMTAVPRPSVERISGHVTLNRDSLALLLALREGLSIAELLAVRGAAFTLRGLAALTRADVIRFDTPPHASADVVQYSAPLVSRADPPVLPIGSPWFLLVVLGAALLVSGCFGVVSTVGALALLFQAIFIVFFLRHFAFAAVAWRSARVDLRTPIIPPAVWPTVTVLVACKNEQAVVHGLVGALLKLDYPRESVQFVVIDDGSSDDTPAILDELAQHEPRLHYLRRAPGSPGGKSGALNAGLRLARGEFLVIFDADHQPRPDVLRRLIRHFQDPRVAAVQGRCVIRNPCDTPLARMIALDYLAGYLVNEYGRQALFGLPAYGGANCAVRASDLLALGGWNERSVTEDTDLTLRLLLLGKRVRYDISAVDTEEAVTTVRQFWKQRYRWARGHQQVWRDYRLAMWLSPHLSAWQKFETTLFLLVFHVPVLTGVASLALLGLMFVLPSASWLLENFFLLWTLLYLGSLIEVGTAIMIAGLGRRDILHIPFFFALFQVSSFLCSKAWLDGILGRPYGWVKTARAGDVAHDTAVSSHAATVPLVRGSGAT